VKWKGSLFFRIVICTVDEDKSVNEFGEWLIELCMHCHDFNILLDVIFTLIPEIVHLHHCIK